MNRDLDEALSAPWLAGGGEAGALVRALDWSATPLGPIASWPQSLKTTVATVLHSRHPMFLWWGAELIQIYNDAYAPTFGIGKHPAAMGQRGEDCWQEIWPIIYPQIHGVMAAAEASWNVDQLVPTWRNGRIEEVHWTYGYSPVWGESGSVAGTLVVCTETTGRVLADRRALATQTLARTSLAAASVEGVARSLASVVADAPADTPFALLYLATTNASGGASALRLATAIGLSGSLLHAVDAACRERLSHAPTREPFDFAADALSSPLPGGPWPEAATTAIAMSIVGNHDARGHIVFGLSPRLPFDDAYREYLHRLAETTDAALARIDRRKDDEDKWANAYRHFMQAPFLVAVFRGRHHRIELANPEILRAWGKPPEIVGLPLEEGIPELRGQPFIGYLDGVFTTGIPYEGREELVRLPTGPGGAIEEVYCNFVYAPLRAADGTVEGILASAFLVTEQVLARHALERALLRAETSESQAKQLVDNLPELAWNATPEGHIDFYNQRWYDYTGTSTEDVEGWGCGAIHDPALLPEIVARWKHSLGTGEIFELELPLRRRDGVFRWFLTRAIPLRDAGGHIVRWFGTNTDVDDLRHERRRAEALAAELSLTTQRLHAAQRAAMIGIFEWDVAAGRVTWSPEIYRLMGIEPGSIAPSPQAWTEALAVDDRERGWEAFRSAAAARAETMEVELRLLQPGGDVRWARLTTQLDYDDDGVARVLGAVVDIQALKEATAARTRALDEAERVSRAKDEFLATMSHELRTPLNAMLGWATMLRNNTADTAKVERGLTVIERNARAQSRLISDLLDVSRIISGKLRLTVRKTDIAAVVHAAVDVVKQAADAKGVSLGVNVEPNLGSIMADADRLQQIVWNLLSNAVKFTPVRGRVIVIAERKDSFVHIVVEDTGAGIADAHLPFVFESFRQIDGTSTRAQGGLGLGLAIVRHLTESHGGTVAAASGGVGLGATFTVTLPIHAVVMPEVEHEESASGSDTPMSTGARALGDLRLLIVDDDADSLDLLRVVLESAGARVTAVSSAKQALDAARTSHFDAVISDIGMPEMDGYAFVRTLRANEAGAPIPAVALTAYARAEDAAQARRAGFHEHLTKPVDAHALVAVVRRLTAAVGPESA